MHISNNNRFKWVIKIKIIERGETMKIMNVNKKLTIWFLRIIMFLMKLKILWYDSFITLRVKPKSLQAWVEEAVLFNLEQAKKYYEKHFLNYKE